MKDDYKNFVERMTSFEDTLSLEGPESNNKKNVVTRNRSAIANQDDNIKHYGVLGMHWGQRRSGFVGPQTPKYKPDANSVGAISRAVGSASDVGKSINKSGNNKKSLSDAKKLSDDDLKTLTTRLNLENNYVNAKTQQVGRSNVENVLTTVGSTMAFVASAAVMVDAINKARG